MRSHPPDRVLVLSDLHMSAGAWPGESPDPLEHFFHDRELAGLLQRLAGRYRRCRRRGCLILNGDVFDFVRVVRLPATAGEVDDWRALLGQARSPAPAGVLEDASAGRFSTAVRRYGPDATEHESIWKLLAIARGHALVFAALAGWCRAGHELVVIRGNHDAEWAWPGVRRALRVLLGAPGREPLPANAVRFRMHAFRRHNLHVEHGHVVRWTTHAEGRFTAGPRRRLKQPFGSYVNRYVLNPVERLAQGASGLSPSGHMKQQLRNEPVRLWRGLLRQALRSVPPLGRDTWRIWQRRAHGWWPTRVGIGLAALVLLLHPLAPELARALSLDSVQTRAAAALLALAAPHLGLALVELVAIVRDDTSRRAREHARRIAGGRTPSRGKGERVVILGHTHFPELLSWQAAGGRSVYANPGCWMNEGDELAAVPRFVWCAWQGSGYGRTRIMALVEGRCRTHSRD